MLIMTPIVLIGGIIYLAVLGGIIYLFILLVKALRKYLSTKEVREEKSSVKRTLARREGCRMTQEFVAESIGVSRQAVSKWEVGASDPSTSNLFALAKLFGVSVEELLEGVK